MMNTKLLAVITQPPIYTCFSNWKTFWEESSQVSKSSQLVSSHLWTCGCINVRKDREIKGSDKYVTFEILLKFYSLDKMKITFSEPKDNLVRSWNGLITSLGIKAKVGPKKDKRQGMPSEMSVWTTFKILSESFRNCLIKIMRGRGLNMSLLEVNFT